MDNVYCGIIGVEIPRNQSVYHRLTGETCKDLRLVIQPRSPEKECTSRVVFLRSLDFLKLLMVLFLVAGEIILDLCYLIARQLGNRSIRFVILTSAKIAYQCASEAKIALPLSTFMIPMLCATSFISLSSPSSLILSGSSGG